MLVYSVHPDNLHWPSPCSIGNQSNSLFTLSPEALQTDHQQEVCDPWNSCLFFKFPSHIYIIASTFLNIFTYINYYIWHFRKPCDIGWASLFISQIRKLGFWEAKNFWRPKVQQFKSDEVSLRAWAFFRMPILFITLQMKKQRLRKIKLLS